MKVINMSDVETQDVKTDLFTGTVHTQNVIDADVAKGFRFGMVKFDAGVRNIFHTHSNEQVLLIMEGKGIVATEDKEVTVTPGMLVYIPAGEKHWHGATKDSAFSHIAFMPPGETSF